MGAVGGRGRRRGRRHVRQPPQRGSRGHHRRRSWPASPFPGTASSSRARPPPAIALASPRRPPGDVVRHRRQGPRDDPDDRRARSCPSTTGPWPASCWQGAPVIALLIAGGGRRSWSRCCRHALPDRCSSRSRGQGQPILGPEDRGPDHQHKAGTPTMGGIAILVAAAVGYLVAHFREGALFSDQALIMIGGIAALAFARLPRRLRQGAPSPQPRLFGRRRAWIMPRLSFAIATAGRAAHRASTPRCRSPAPTGPGGSWAWSAGHPVAGAHHLLDRQRREHHRRPRRPGRRLVHLRLLRLHRHRLLGLPEPDLYASS